MLRIAFVVIVVFQITVSAMGGNLKVERARIVGVDRASELHRLCGIARQIDACTRFVGYALSATCNGSTISASARFTPVMVVLVPAAVGHEYMHISDVQKSASVYLDALSRRTFTTSVSCEKAAALELAAFESRFAQFVAKSTAFRHPGGRR